MQRKREEQFCMAEPVNKQHIECVLGGLTELAANVALRAMMNLTDLHVHSENFYAGLLKIVYGWNLRNANAEKQNAEGIDLVDDESKIIVQVTGTCSKPKIDHSLNELKDTYAGYHFVFLPIVNSSKAQRKYSYKAPHGISFDPRNDILDIVSIVRELSKPDASEKAEAAAGFIRKNLVNIVSDSHHLASGLEYIILHLSKGDSEDDAFDMEDFKIDAKISFNNLNYGKDVIHDCAGQYGRVQSIYDEYDGQGQNKSAAVLHKLRSIYLLEKQQYQGDELFRRIEKAIVESVNIVNMPDDFTYEELEMCADMLMVHAFMDCKIFEKPI